MWSCLLPTARGEGCNADWPKQRALFVCVPYVITFASFQHFHTACAMSTAGYQIFLFPCFWGPQTHGPTPPSATLGVLLPWQRCHKTPVVIRLMDWVNNIAPTPPSATAHPTAPAAIGTCAQQLKIIFYSSVAALIILQYNLQLELLCYSLRRIIVAFCVFLGVHVCTCCQQRCSRAACLILMLRKGPLPDRICVFMFGEQGENGSWYFKSSIFSLGGEIVYYIMFNYLTYLKR